MTPCGRPDRTFGPRFALVLVAVSVAAALVTACASTPAPATPSDGPVRPAAVRVGSANFPENRLLAEIYATGLERSGVAVERRFSVGAREVSVPAIRDGALDVVPEYTGNLLLFLAGRIPGTEREEVYRALSAALPPTLRLLSRARAEDTDAVVVTRAYATEHNLRSIVDLVPLCSSIAFGGPPEFQQRPYGTPGLATMYGCSFGEFRPLDASGPATVAALRDGTVKAADIFSTDASIGQNDFVVLSDPRGNFSAQDVVPLVSAAVASDPRVTGALDCISRALDTTALADLNRRDADLAGPDTAGIAADWVGSIGC